VRYPRSFDVRGPQEHDLDSIIVQARTQKFLGLVHSLRNLMKALDQRHSSLCTVFSQTSEIQDLPDSIHHTLDCILDVIAFCLDVILVCAFCDMPFVILY
jgi:hypothetical protein